MMPTKDHETIRTWAARYGAVPAEKLPDRVDSAPALLTFIVGTTGVPDIRLLPISWELFFAKFDLLDLWFAHDDDRSSRFDLVHVEKKPGAELPN